MENILIGMISETSIHAGVGQSVGALDLPVAREQVTDYPFVPGSGVKGAARVWAKERTDLDKKTSDDLFGPKDQAQEDKGAGDGAGKLLFGDLRLLLLPVRSLSSAYKWVTCPQILGRLKRDMLRQGGLDIPFTTPVVKPKHFLGQGETGDWLGLEEREFEYQEAVSPDILSNIQKVMKAVIPGQEAAASVESRLVILRDDDFAWFAKYALPIMARNVLEEGTKKSKNLWYEESLPPDTVMYSLWGEREKGTLSKVSKAIEGACYIQIGGNETIGQGWFRMGVIPVGENVT